MRAFERRWSTFQHDRHGMVRDCDFLEVVELGPQNITVVNSPRQWRSAVL